VLLTTDSCHWFTSFYCTTRTQYLCRGDAMLRASDAW